jgi:DNA-binding NtrC family response regulator
MTKPRLLIAASPTPASSSNAWWLGLPDATLEFQPDLPAAMAQVRAGWPDLLILPHCPPDTSALEWLTLLRTIDSQLPTLVVTDEPSAELLMQLLRLKAGDVLPSSVSATDLSAVVDRLLGMQRARQEVELLKRQHERPHRFDDFVGSSPLMRKVFDRIEQIAETDVDVLIRGETGTGKELVARSLHQRSRRAEKPFIAVDCGAIPENLLESEFFGHERGAFTGADSRRIGLLEYADGGTFFLDEVGELPLLLQAKLLRTLQERTLRRVGGREEIKVDVRVVAATARPLEEMIRLKSFREDLYYRINVVQLDLPPLRQRGDDLGLLIEHFAQRFSREMRKPVVGITPEAYQVLARYRWPGNVRELQNVMRRGIALSKGPLVSLDELPDELVASAGQGMDTPAVAGGSDGGFFAARERCVADFERDYLRSLLVRHQGNVKAAADEAGLPRGTLYRLMKNHQLDGQKFR